METKQQQQAAAEAAFATPDREGNYNVDATMAPKSEKEDDEQLNTVTPLDGEGDKQVRFDENDRKSLVSRRGGRLGSPAAALPRVTSAPSSSKDDAPVLEFKTFRSPQRTKEVENDTIPSLCSTNSGPLEKKKGRINHGGAGGKQQATAAKGDDKASESARRPSSISCDPSMIATTSPLASQDVDGSPSGQARKSNAATVSTPAMKPIHHAETRNVTFSPPTPHSQVVDRTEMPKKTPTKSPLPSQFQSLPSLHDAKLTPGGIFLSPSPPPPNNNSVTGLSSVPTLDAGDDRKKAAIPKTSAESKKEDTSKPSTQEEKAAAAAAARDLERERVVATPTDFALDFGKGLRPTGSFDASNVLAWLQSPTANGLFSPGGGLGFGSAMNTPRAGTAPRTPRTPTNTTSFFFSDVASLPRNNEFGSPRASPKGDSVGAGKRGPQGVYSSMICISPLASKNRKGSSQPQTPMNYNDVFASPRERQEMMRPTNLPYLGESPSKGKTRKRDGSVDAHMAERDLMEDEDLSVLLQLASHNTPGRSRDGGPHVFRSQQDASAAGLGGLQLPVIDGQGESSSKLSRKPGSSDHGGACDDFTPPQLAIRSSSSSGSKEIYLGGAKSSVNDHISKSSSNAAAGGAIKGSTGTKTGKGTAKKNSRKIPAHAMPSYPYPGEHPPLSYYPMHGMAGMPPGGSMRVVVGGPPPMPPSSRLNGKGSPSRHSSSPSRRPPYPPPMPPPGSDGRYPGMPYQHHGHAPYPPPPHMGGMGMPPHYPGHYPPPPHHPGHLPMYPPHPPIPPEKKAKGKPKTGTKRGPGRPPSNPDKSPAAKKPRKSPTKKSKKKVSSASRQKSAAAAHAASGGKNEKAAVLAAAIMRGVTMRPSGKWQAQLYFAGKSRYIGVFDSREKAATAYEIAREKLKEAKVPGDNSPQGLKATEAAVNMARKAAFDGVNEKDPRVKKNNG